MTTDRRPPNRRRSPRVAAATAGACAVALLAVLLVHHFSHDWNRSRLGSDGAQLTDSRARGNADNRPPEATRDDEPSTAGAASAIVAVDPATGQPREPDAEARHRLASAVREHFAGYGLGEHPPFAYANGMISYVWGGLSVSLARIHGDGRVETDCVSSPEQAAALIEKDSPSASRNSTKPEM